MHLSCRPESTVSTLEDISKMPSIKSRHKRSAPWRVAPGSDWYACQRTLPIKDIKQLMGVRQ